MTTRQLVARILRKLADRAAPAAPEPPTMHYWWPAGTAVRGVTSTTSTTFPEGTWTTS